jgi:putative transposase
MREPVRGMCIDWGVSIRGACGALRFDTSAFHDKSRRTDQAAVEGRIREICETPVRSGCRRVHILLRREGRVIKMKKTRRICTELGLRLRNRHPKRRGQAKLRDDRQEAVGPTDARAMDLVHDRLATGKKPRLLTVIDSHSRFCPATDPRFACRGGDGVQTPERVCARIGDPGTIRVDNGSESLSRDLDLRACANEVTPGFSRPGHPADTGFIEAFNSKRRTERLNAHRFMSLADARETMEDWRRDCNEVRPHSAIGCNVPIDTHPPDGVTSPAS